MGLAKQSLAVKEECERTAFPHIIFSSPTLLFFIAHEVTYWRLNAVISGNGRILIFF